MTDSTEAVIARRPLSLKEASLWLHLSEPYLRRLVREGKGPRSYRSGRKQHVFLVEDLRAWLVPEEKFKSPFIWKNQNRQDMNPAKT